MTQDERIKALVKRMIGHDPATPITHVIMIDGHGVVYCFSREQAEQCVRDAGEGDWKIVEVA